MIDKIAQPREQDEMFQVANSGLLLLRQEDEIQADVCYQKWLGLGAHTILLVTTVGAVT